MIVLNRQSGSVRPTVIGIVALCLLIIIGGGWWLVKSSMGTSEIRQVAHGPICGDTPVVALPVGLSAIQSILYPGQLRGGNYKPHGGFRLESTSNDAEVKLPLTSKLIDGSRYIEQGEVQYLLDFKTDCDLRIRFDHLKVVSIELMEEISKLPEPKQDDSRTSALSGKEYPAGTILATKVGFIGTSNATFDFGLYDYSQKNSISHNVSWSADPQHQSDNAQYAVCWINYLNQAEKEGVRKLPAADQVSGKTSDYCN